MHHTYGFIDKFGHWVVKPEFKAVGSFSSGLAAVATGVVGFDPEEWKMQGKQFHLARGDLFELFVKQYKLIGMPRKQVNELLGKGEARFLDSDTYTLMNTGCGNAYAGVEIRYENGIATKYRQIGLFRGSEHEWITK